MEIDSAYAILTDENTPLFGFNKKFQDQSQFPVLYNPRPILPQQLQFYLDTSGRQMRTHFPVRITIYDGTRTVESVSNHGLDVEGDGSIWLNGLSDDLRVNQTDCLYTGSLIQAPDQCKLRKITLNAAVPLDHRIDAVANISQNQIDPAMAKELGGGMMLYMDMPEGFKEHHQVNSSPCSATSMAGSGGPSEVPINQILEDDSGRIDGQVYRRTLHQSWMKRLSSWALIGIHPEYGIGKFIGQVVVRGQAGDTNYRIDAPIERLLIDFKDQVTRIGGLLSQAGKGEKSKRAFTRGHAPVGGGNGGGFGRVVASGRLSSVAMLLRNRSLDCATKSMVLNRQCGVFWKARKTCCGIKSMALSPVCDVFWKDRKSALQGGFSRGSKN